MQLGGAPAQQLGRREIAADQCAGLRAAARVRPGSGGDSGLSGRAVAVLQPYKRHVRSAGRSVKPQASPWFGTKPCKNARPLARRRPRGILARQRPAGTLREAALGEEAADLQVEVQTRLQSPEQLHDQAIAIDDR